MSTNERTYPYNAWVLMPSFKPVERTFAKKYDFYSFDGLDHGDLTSEGKLVARFDIFPSKQAAIEEGVKRLDKQQADLDKKQQNILKRRLALVKAAGSKA